MPQYLGPPADILWSWGRRPGSYMGGETGLERGLGLPLKGTVDVLCVSVRVLTHARVCRQYWSLL